MSYRIIHFLAFILLGFQALSVAGVRKAAPPDRYLTERALGGIKMKVADNFTVGAWGALYYGTSYFPNRLRFDPLIYQGYDLVPGFMADLGKIVGNAKLSLGGDYYYMWRDLEYDDEPSIIHHRLRGNVTVSVPFAGSCNMAVTQRFERVLFQRWAKEQDPNGNYYGELIRSGDPGSFWRLRTTFKLSGPSFTSLNIVPYSYYEGFSYNRHINYPVDPYYFETEIGISLSPSKAWSFSLADQIQSTPVRRGWETHQISFYMFYTLDFSKQISKLAKSLR